MAFQWAASQYIGTVKIKISGNSSLMGTLKSNLPAAIPPSFTQPQVTGKLNYIAIDPFDPSKADLIVKIEGPGRNLEGFARMVVNKYGIESIISALHSIDPSATILTHYIEVEDRGKTDPAYIAASLRGGVGGGDWEYIEQSIEKSPSPNYMNTGTEDGFYQGQDGKKHHILEPTHTDEEISNLLGYPYVRPSNQ